MDNALRGGVLMLPGGKPQSAVASRPWQLANARMALIARSLRRRLGDGVAVRLVQYRLRGWNSGRFDALRDAELALGDMREEFDSTKIVVVGHSMGGRVAAHLSASGDVGAVVALAPWWPRNDADLVPASCRLLVARHRRPPDRSRLVAGTDPPRPQARCERTVGGDGGRRASMIRDWRRWHRLTAEFAAAQLAETLPEQR